MAVTARSTTIAVFRRMKTRIMKTFNEALTELAKAEHEYAGTKKPLGEAIVARRSLKRLPSLFSSRTKGTHDDVGGYEEHVRDLEKALSLTGDNRLEPIVVFEVAGVDYVVDGHHRYAAYKNAKVDQIPVVRIGGTLKDAVVAGLDGNTRMRLPLTKWERHEAAWKLVKMRHGSIPEQAKWSGMGTAFISKLRKMHTALVKEHGADHDFGSLDEAKELLEGGGGERPEWTEDMLQAQIEDYAKRLKKTFGNSLKLRTVAVVAALASIVKTQSIVEAIEGFGDTYGPIEWEDQGTSDF
ncbi:MAG: ParB/RepB/Spo0J family partition protein [Phyllobacterium sp.]|uniref:ParB/RepB/Spo0J family partition protein n=1 Tax=Phyllobacterium sp. TaxID=1871046 RepID=UPI0030F24E6A